jgi:hypothetical protein
MRFLALAFLVACGPASTPEDFGEAYLVAYCDLSVECSNGYSVEECFTDYAPGVTALYTSASCPDWDVAAAQDCLDDFERRGCDETSLTPSSCNGLCDG